jgi:predicted lysophospholipase L1 biosynthesis ABC-type transport system permease subunit
MTVATLTHIVALSLVGSFGLAGTLHIAAPRVLREAYRNWQFPRGFYYVVGVAQLVAALFVAEPRLRIWGVILAAMILFVTVVSLLNHGKYSYAVPVILMMLALPPAMISAI